MQLYWTRYIWAGEMSQGYRMVLKGTDIFQQSRHQSIYFLEVQTIVLKKTWLTPAGWKRLLTILHQQLSNNVPILQGISNAISSNPNKREVQTLAFLAEYLELGYSVVQAISQIVKLEPYELSILQACEGGGNLPQTLQQLLYYYETKENYRRMLMKSLRYPIIMVAISSALLTGILIWIVPEFHEFFQQQGNEVPHSTQMLFNISNTLHQPVFWYGFMLAVAGLGLSKKLWKPWFNRLVLLWLGESLQWYQFIHVIWLQTSLGVMIAQSLQQATKILVNKKKKKQIEQVIKLMEQGVHPSTALSSCAAFPVAWRQLWLGAQSNEILTGQLESLLQQQKQQMQTAMHTIQSYVEPVAMLIVSGTVGGALLLLYMPLFSLGASL